MTVQRHPIDYIIGALMLRKKNRHADAIDEITACIDMILAACTDLEDKKIELHCRSLAAMFERYAEVQIPIEYVGYLMQSVRLRYEFLATQGAREEVERALRDFEIMQRAAAGKVRWSRRNPNDESSRA